MSRGKTQHSGPIACWGDLQASHRVVGGLGWLDCGREDTGSTQHMLSGLLKVLTRQLEAPFPIGAASAESFRHPRFARLLLRSSIWPSTFVLQPAALLAAARLA
mgnify:CR=1 FL=1